MKSFKLLIIVIMILSMISIATALEYNNETIKQDLTTFEWNFNPNLQKDFYKENFMPYVDIVEGCEDIKIELFAVLPIKYTETIYYNETTCLLKDDKTLPKVNGTYPQYNNCIISEKSKTQSVEYEELFDLSTTDVFMTKEMSWLIKGTRKANIGFQSCDMNLKIDLDNDGVLEYDVKNDGKAWFNLSWNFRREITIDQQSYNHTEGFVKLLINDTIINYEDFYIDGLDIRFTYENDSLTSHFIELWNTTGTSIIWVKLPVNASGTSTGFIYYNSTIFVDVNSLDNTFSQNVNFFLPFNDGFADLSDRGQAGTKVGTPIPEVAITHERFTHTESFQQADTDYIHYDNPLGDGDQVFSVWAKHKDTGGSQEYAFYMYASGQPQLALASATTDDLFAQIGAGGTECNLGGTDAWLDDDWHFFFFVMNDTGNRFSVYIDGIFVDSVFCTATNFDSSTTREFPIGSLYNHAAGGSWDGNIDEIYFFDGFPSDIDGFMNNLYVLPTYTIGAEEGSIISTNLFNGLFDESFNNISLLIDEGEEWFVWGNLTYNDNNSVVYPNSFCNWSANNVIEEKYNQTIGTNLTVCTSGCDSVNYSVLFSDRDTDNFIEDIFRYKLCKSSSATDIFTINTNCTSSYSFSHSTIPLCSNGYVNITLMDSNCSSSKDVLLSISSTANTLSKSLILFDSFVGNDLVHNITDELMVWNNTLQVFTSVHTHEYYEHGAKNITVDCNANVSDIENQTSIIEITVVNRPPTIFLDTIWWWLLNETPISFTSSIQARYPLTNLINISGGCQDDDLFNAGINLTFNNNTLIYETIFLASSNQVPTTVNFSQSNFSIEDNYLDGILEYNFGAYCNDTTGNISTVSRMFSAINEVPVVNWTNSTPLAIGMVPSIINWSVSDAELDNGFTCYLYQNGTLNTSGVITGHTVNVNEGVYNFSVVCEDSLRNSTQTDLLLTFSPSCTSQVFGLEIGGRYRTLTKELSVNCSNGIILTNCWYYTNKYSWESISNCSLFNVTFQKGWNDLSIVVNDGFNTTSSFNIWATDPSSNVFDYVLLWVYFLSLSLFYVLAVITGLGVFYAFGGFMGLLIGYELVALSPWVGLAVGAAILIGSLTLLILKK